MLKERIQEVLDFTKSESPYRKANQGWINQDIFLDLKPSSDQFKKTNEDAKVILFWSPINSLLSNIFLIIILGSLLVFTSVSFVKGRFDFDLFSRSAIIDIVEVEKNNASGISDLEDIDSTNSKIQQNIATKELDKPNEIKSLADDLIKSDQDIINKKIDQQDSSLIERQPKKDITILQNKKPKSNFI